MPTQSEIVTDDLSHRHWALAQHHLVKRRERLDQRSEQLSRLLGRQHISGVKMNDLCRGGLGLPDILADQSAPVVVGPDHLHPNRLVKQHIVVVGFMLFLAERLLHYLVSNRARKMG